MKMGNLGYNDMYPDNTSHPQRKSVVLHVIIVVYNLIKKTDNKSESQIANKASISIGQQSDRNGQVFVFVFCF